MPGQSIYRPSFGVLLSLSWLSPVLFAFHESGTWCHPKHTTPFFSLTNSKINWRLSAIVFRTETAILTSATAAVAGGGGRALFPTTLTTTCTEVTTPTGFPRDTASRVLARRMVDSAATQGEGAVNPPRNLRWALSGSLFRALISCHPRSPPPKKKITHPVSFRAEVVPGAVREAGQRVDPRVARWTCLATVRGRGHVRANDPENAHGRVPSPSPRPSPSPSPSRGAGRGNVRKSLIAAGAASAANHGGRHREDGRNRPPAVAAARPGHLPVGAKLFGVGDGAGQARLADGGAVGGGAGQPRCRRTDDHGQSRAPSPSPTRYVQRGFSCDGWLCARRVRVYILPDMENKSRAVSGDRDPFSSAYWLEYRSGFSLLARSCDVPAD